MSTSNLDFSPECSSSKAPTNTETNMMLDDIPLSPLRDEAKQQLPIIIVKELHCTISQENSLASTTDGGLSPSSPAPLLNGGSRQDNETSVDSNKKNMSIIVSTCRDANKMSNNKEPAHSNQDSPGTLKWFALILTCMLLMGTDYCYDLPGAIGAGEGVTIQTHFTQRGETYNQKMNQALFAVYSYPNMVMTIIGGLLIDKYLGLRKATLLFGGTVVVACFLFAVGVATTSYSILVAARFLFGSSAESLAVSQSSFVSRWFGGSKYMAFAFGISVSFSRLGGALVYLVSPVVANAFGAPASAFAGFGVAFISFCSTLALVWLDYRSERRGLIAPQPVGGSSGHGQEDAELGSSNKKDGFADDEALQHPFQLSYFRTLPKTLWLLAISCGLSYGSAFPFVAIAKTYFERVYEMDAGTASFDTGLFHLLGAVLCPLVGLVVGQIGRGPMWLGLSATGFATLYAFLALFPGTLSAVAVMFFASLFYAAFVGGLWSFVNFTTPRSAGGFAFGILIAGCNFGLATNPLVTGTILDAYTGMGTVDSPTMVDAVGSEELLPSAQGFRIVLVFLTFSALLALANAIILWRVDKSYKGVLMADPSKRLLLKAELDNEVMSSWRKQDAETVHKNKKLIGNNPTTEK